FDEVDALTGPAIGRSKSATYRTADVVGLDTMAHVVKTMGDTLPADPWAAFYQAPEWLAQLIAKGALGSKTKAGVYTKKGKDILVLDVAKKDYRPSAGAVAEEVQAILKEKNPGEQLAKLRASKNPQAQFIWATSRTARVTSTSPSAGASAGSAVPSSCGRPRAGRRWPP